MIENIDQSRAGFQNIVFLTFRLWTKYKIGDGVSESYTITKPYSVELNTEYVPVSLRMAALLHRKPDMTPVTPAVIIHMSFVYDWEEQSLKWRYHVSLKHWYPFPKVLGVTT